KPFHRCAPFKAGSNIDQQACPQQGFIAPRAGSRRQIWTILPSLDSHRKHERARRGRAAIGGNRWQQANGFLGVGVIGLGGASLAMIPKFVQNPNFRVAAAADFDTEILDRFRKDFPDAESYDDAARLCGSCNVELVYIATPNRFHAEHAMEAACPETCRTGLDVSVGGAPGRPGAA